MDWSLKDLIFECSAGVSIANIQWGEHHNKSFVITFGLSNYMQRRVGTLRPGCVGLRPWFETFVVHSELYQVVITKPLISMSTVGSIEIENRVKPLKDTILTK